MSLIHAESCPCTKTELELFNLPPTQVSIDSSRFVEYHPITSLDRGGPIEFRIEQSEDYLDLSEIYLYTKNQILDANGDAITNNEVVYPIDYYHATQFSALEVSLNNKTITNETNYPYRAIFDSKLSYSHDAKKTQLLSGGMLWPDQTYIDFNSVVAADVDKIVTDNAGAKYRFNKTKNSKKFETFGKIHCDTFLSNSKLLLPKVDLKIKLRRANPEFCLLSNEGKTYQTSILSAVLFVKHVKVNDAVRDAHENKLQISNAKYNFNRCEVRTFARGPNREDISENNLVSGILPTRVFIALIDSKGFNGDYKCSPFNHQLFKVKKIALRCNGIPIGPGSLETSESDASDCLRHYFTMFHALGTTGQNFGNDITFENYKNGHAFFGFDLSPDNSHENFSLLKEGNLSLELKLGTASSSSIVIVAYLEYPSVLEIDKDRNVIYEQ